jgi:hypothetical protein
VHATSSMCHTPGPAVSARHPLAAVADMHDSDRRLALAHPPKDTMCQLCVIIGSGRWVELVLTSVCVVCARKS